MDDSMCLLFMESWELEPPLALGLKWRSDTRLRDGASFGAMDSLPFHYVWNTERYMFTVAEHCARFISSI